MNKVLLFLLSLCGTLGVAAQLPYTTNFPSADDFSSAWTVVNGSGSVSNPDEDYCKWEYYEWSTNTEDGSGCAACGSYNGQNDDWLIMANPLTLKAGKHHLTFYAHRTMNSDKESLDVALATKADKDAMEAIASFDIDNSDWKLKVVNFEVKADGNYYFAFHSKTNEADSYQLVIDDITIDEGEYQTSPKLTVAKALLPYSNCDLSEETPIGVRLSNVGTGAASTFNIWYVVNKGDTVRQTVTANLGPDETADFYFKQAINLLDLGDYAITVGVECNGESATATANVSHYAPITELPIQTDFYTNTGVSDIWTILGDKSWSYSMWGGYYEAAKSGVDNALLSRCITFNHPFRVKIAYTGGSYYGPSGFYVAYGKPNTDISTWTKAYEDYNITEGKETEFTVNPPSAGEYSLAIVDSSSSGFKLTCIYQVVISELYNHDIRIEKAVSPTAPYTPANHLNASATYGVTVSNRGLEAVTGVNVSVKKGDAVLATSSAAASLAKGDSVSVDVTTALTGVKVGDKIALSVVTDMNETDEYVADNVVELPTVLATDTVFAMENEATVETGTGAYGQPIAFGNVYTLAETDTLTSITVGLTSEYWGEATDKMGLAVYSLKDDGKVVDRQLLSLTAPRATDGVWQTFAFAPRVLPAGKYFFEVQQLSETMLGLGYVEDANGVCYQAINDTLVTTEGAYLVIRANFGHGAKPYKNNVAVKEIASPTMQKALFSSNETVKVVVENQSAEEAKGVSVRCQVGANDKAVSVDLLPYETKTVDIEGIDLAAPGEYVLTMTATLNGDENAADNTLSMNLIAEKEESPYTLDFEHCNDFATGHEFNPRWWTENRTGAETDGFWRLDYPHNSEAGCGFIAFNVRATTPDMTTMPEDEQVPGFFAHSGERFGAAFARGWNEDQTLTSDTWLVSPKLALSTNSSLELYVKTHAIESQGLELEKYRLLVSDTDDNFDSFKVIGGDREAPLDWTKVTLDLSDYNNKEVYVALQYVSQIAKGVVMMVDDINVITDGVSAIGRTLASGDVSVSLAGGMLTVQSGTPITSVQLYDAAGKAVCRANGLNNTFYRQSLAKCQPGIYIAHIKTSLTTMVKRLVLVR